MIAEPVHSFFEQKETKATKKTVVQPRDQSFVFFVSFCINFFRTQEAANLFGGGKLTLQASGAASAHR